LKQPIAILLAFSALLLIGCTATPRSSGLVVLPAITAPPQMAPGPAPTMQATSQATPKGKVWNVQINPGQIFPISLDIGIGDTVVFVNMNQYGTRTLVFDDGFPEMTLRFQHRANRTFIQPGRYTYHDSMRGYEAEINAR